MSIKKRLIASNIAMIVIPIVLFLLLEVVIATLIFSGVNGAPVKKDSQWFMSLRFIGLLFILIVTNGILTYMVSKTILKPIRILTKAAEEISNGNLDHEILSVNKDELGKLSETFESMRIQLKKAREERELYENNRKEFVASISHDLKTPLTSIKGYIHGVLDGIADNPETKQMYLQTAYQKADDMDHLINELFLYSKLDLEQFPFQFETVQLDNYLEDYLQELQYDASFKDVAITFRSEPSENYSVMADRLSLGRIIDNIIQNSLKYSDKTEKKISVSLQSKSDAVTVKFADNGKGIPKESLPRIFESFYRADPSRNKTTGGSGLGLAIVKKIVERHGGEIWAESGEGKGTSIYFTLKKRKVGEGNAEGINH
ncbi:HAMP domain-containing histidine kinase [Fictibacillus nanhaiensis]|uniref:histidine kinase n=1 Tax=Fictibacillus nanhaiensis TaxID=742169 RepID=A0ABS2ZQB1_9BACL|nr:HAMP domain-containing histidine kinase [Fictibacillus nanhaiensis]